MTNLEKSQINCPKCGGELQSSITGFFYPKELKILWTFGGLLITGFFYIMFLNGSVHFNSSGDGKSLIFVPALIIAAIHKIGKPRKEVHCCSKCKLSNFNDQIKP